MTLLSEMFPIIFVSYLLFSNILPSRLDLLSPSKNTIHQNFSK